MTITELANETVEAMLALGLSPVSAWGMHAKVFKPIIRLHEDIGEKEFNQEVMYEYTYKVQERIKNGEITSQYYRQFMRGIERITEMHETGKLEWSGPKYATRFKLNGYFENIKDEFLDSGGFSVKGRSDAMWMCRKYFAWLIIEGHEDLSDVGAVEVQQFMIYCSHHMRSSSMHNVKLYTKKLYAFLFKNSYATSDFKGLLDFRVSRESKLYPPALSEEVDTVLNIIDRHIPRGKRDYAIIMLEIVTGLRAIDIAKLKLNDIDWINGEIKIVQSKTKQSLVLPLTKDVGEALQDYILNGRQETDSEIVFLRMRAPFQGFTNGNAIGDLFDDYRKKAGLPRDAFDGKSFHSLRRSVGKNMITSGVSVSIIAQVLGDANIDSVKKYISLDSHHLKECALDFTGIAITEVAK